MLGDALSCCLLLTLDRLQQLVSVQLLNVLRSLQVVLEALLVGNLGLVLLPVDVLLADDELLVVLLHSLLELLVLPLHLLFLVLFGSLRHAVHVFVRLLGCVHFLAQVTLVGIY